MRILEAARKHGIGDDDMLHAVRTPLRIIDLNETETLHIGGGADATLLEVVVADDLDGEGPRIIHAMKLRKTFRRFL